MVLFWCFLILFFRAPDSFVHPQFWAEDGVIFFRESFVLGFKSLFLPYAGYQLLFYRLIAYVVSFFPALYAPSLYNLLTCATTLGVIALILSDRLQLKNKSLLALTLVLVPHSGEVFMNLTNLQWFFGVGSLILIAFEEPKSRLQVVFDYMTLFIFGMTGVFAILFSPLWLLRFLKNRTRHSFILLGIAGVTSCIQAYFVSQGLRGQQPISQVEGKIWVQVIGNTLGGKLFLGQEIMSLIAPYFPFLLTCIVLTFLILAMVRKKDFRILVFFLGGILVFASSIARMRANFYGLSLPDRYLYIPHVTLTWCIILLLLDEPKYIRVGKTLLMLALLSSATHFQRPLLADLNWEEESKAIQGNQILRPIKIHPSGWHIFPTTKSK